jgi:hypothetical protein
VAMCCVILWGASLRLLPVAVVTIKHPLPALWRKLFLFGFLELLLIAAIVRAYGCAVLFFGCLFDRKALSRLPEICRTADRHV